MYTFTIPRDEFDELRPDKQMIRKLIGKHVGLVDRFRMTEALGTLESTMAAVCSEQ